MNEQPLSKFESQKPWKYKKLWGRRHKPTCFYKCFVKYKVTLQNFWVTFKLKAELEKVALLILKQRSDQQSLWSETISISLSFWRVTVIRVTNSANIYEFNRLQKQNVCLWSLNEIKNDCNEIWNHCYFSSK